MNPEPQHQPREEPAEVPVRQPLIEGRDFYREEGFYVFTAAFLRDRGYCCGNGCRHCPYEASTE